MLDNINTDILKIVKVDRGTGDISTAQTLCQQDPIQIKDILKDQILYNNQAKLTTQSDPK